MTGGKKPAAKMTSTGSAKKTTVSRGSKTATQMGNMNQLESGRASKLKGQTLGKVTAAQAKAENPKNKIAEGKKSAVGVRNMQRAGGSKNLSNREMYEKRNSRGK